MKTLMISIIAALGIVSPSQDGEIDEKDQKIQELQQELNEYKKVYDGLILFEDGSWTYRDQEYFFWNFDLQYVNKDKESYCKQQDKLMAEDGSCVNSDFWE